MIRFDREAGYCTAPYSVNISVTEKCPLRCPFCFHEYNNSKELSFRQIRGYIDELVQLGTPQIQFSGGEPLIYPHILESISYAHNKNMRVVLSTSGATVTEDLAQRLIKAGLDCCYISLNGSTANIHEITRDGYRYAINALEIFRKIGLTTAINWVAIHDNIKDLMNVVYLAKSMAVKHISVISLKKPAIDRAYRKITKEDMDILVEYCMKYKDYLIPESCINELLAIYPNNRSMSLGCRAGKFYMAISSNGKFLCCPHIPESSAEAESIEKYWNNDKFLLKVRQGKGCHAVS